MRSILRIFASAALLLAALPATGQNLLINPGFATDLSSWSLDVSFITAAWQPLDATGQGSSGSAALTINAAGLTNGLSQCVPVTAGSSYDFGARIEVPAGQPGLTASMSVIWNQATDCGGTPVGNEANAAYVQSGNDTFVAVSTANHVAPGGARSAGVFLTVSIDPNTSASGVAYFDDAYFQPSGGCTAEATYLCLNNNRFKVEATFDAGNGNAGQAQVVALTADTGYLWFFDPSNVELVVKVLNACALGGHYWVFAGGLTNVNVVITVTDTQTQSKKTYTNPQSTPFQPLQDTAAFSTCP